MIEALETFLIQDTAAEMVTQTRAIPCKKATSTEDIYLRLESKNNVISGYYATAPDQWKRLGRFGNFFQFKKVGIEVSSVRAASDVTGFFDYFEISLPEVPYILVSIECTLHVDFNL